MAVARINVDLSFFRPYGAVWLVQQSPGLRIAWGYIRPPLWGYKRRPAKIWE